MVLSQKRIYLLLLLGILANAITVLLLPAIGLTDAGAHLYNASVLLRFMEGEASFLEPFLQVNKWYIPNWSSHLLLTFFLKLGLSPLWAQKLFILIYVLGLPISSIYFLKQYSGKWQASFLLILPLVYTYVFMLGFFNFMLGMVLLVAGAIFFSKRNPAHRFKHFLFSLFWLGLLYFTHIFVFGIGVLFYAALTIRYKSDRIFRLMSLGLASIPFGVMGLLFLFRDSRIDTAPYSIELKWLIRDLLTASPLQGDSQGLYLWFGLSISLLSLFLLIYGSYKKTLKRTTLPLLFVSLVMLSAYFLLPDSSAGGGYISERFLTLFWLFLLLYLASADWPRPVQMGITVLVVGLTSFKSFVFYQQQVENSKTIVELVQLSKTIPDESLIFIETNNYPVQLKHAHGYLGVSANCLLSENYEAYTDYFPLQWRVNERAYQQLELSKLSANPLALKPFIAQGTGLFFIWSKNPKLESIAVSDAIKGHILYQID